METAQTLFGVISPVTHGQMKPDISKSFFGKCEPNRPPGQVSHHDMIDYHQSQRASQVFVCYQTLLFCSLMFAGFWVA